MDNSKMMYSEEGLDINKQQKAKIKIADLMLLRFKMFEVKKKYGSYCTLKNKAKKEKIENGKYTLADVQRCTSVTSTLATREIIARCLYANLSYAPK